VNAGEETLDATTRKKLNDARWEYSQWVVELTQRSSRSVWSADVEPWDD